MGRRFQFLVITAVLAALPAAAQDGRQGIAFVQAPEQGSGVCMATMPEEGFSCAVAKCMESGASDADCLRTNWCQPAGWSIDIFAQHSEGPHWHEVLCGLPSRTIAEAAAAHMCDRIQRDYLIECSLVQVYDPQGNTMLPE